MGDISKLVKDICEVNADKQFEENIKIFSGFLSQINSDYKYNETYLEQYLSDFGLLKKAIAIKDKEYRFLATYLIGEIKELRQIELDNSYQFNRVLGNKKGKYINIDMSEITSDTILVKVDITTAEGERRFVKKYDYTKTYYENIKKDIVPRINMENN